MTLGLSPINNNNVNHPISYLDTLIIKTGSERSIEATLRKRRILFAGFVACMGDTRRLPKCAIIGELVGGAGCVGGQEKSGWGVSWTTSELLASSPNNSGWL